MQNSLSASFLKDTAVSINFNAYGKRAEFTITPSLMWGMYMNVSVRTARMNLVVTWISVI
jgi:hypothetical protein